MYYNIILFTIFTKILMHLVYPTTFYRTIVSNFSWVLRTSQEKSKTMVMQPFYFWGGGGLGAKQGGFSGQIRLNFPFLELLSYRTPVSKVFKLCILTYVFIISHLLCQMYCEWSYFLTVFIISHLLCQMYCEWSYFLTR